jgi:hypothetical protein
MLFEQYVIARPVVRREQCGEITVVRKSVRGENLHQHPIENNARTSFTMSVSTFSLCQSVSSAGGRDEPVVHHGTAHTATPPGVMLSWCLVKPKTPSGGDTPAHVSQMKHKRSPQPGENPSGAL